MNDPLIQDQEDFFHRIEPDTVIADVKVLLQRKGVVESDIEIALGTLNEKSGKLGAVCVVLMPALVPSEPDAPGPEYFVEIAVQVIGQALFNEGDLGTQRPPEELATRIRQLLHRFNGGLGTWSFARMDPLPVAQGQVSYGVFFRRLARDEELPKAPLPLILPEGGVAPAEVTIEAGDAGSIWYTLDGSYPSSANPNATLYTAPFEIAETADLRAVSYRTGAIPSDVAAARFIASS